MRCKACNRPFNEYERVSKNSKTGDYEDMCVTCRGASGMGYNPEGDIPVSESVMDVPLLDALPGFRV